MLRRKFLSQSGFGLAAAAVSLLMGDSATGAERTLRATGSTGVPHLKPKAKRVIYLFQSGGPSQLDLFDYKPALMKRGGANLPSSIRMGQRLTTMTSGQDSLPIVPSLFSFAQYGKSGAWVSELLPHIAQIVDELCFIKSVHTEAINHDPAVTFFQTGSPLAGRPSMGAWLTYGLGSEVDDLPGFVVMVSEQEKGGQPLYDRLWGSGFLPSQYQGVKFRSVGDPVLYLSNPSGLDRGVRRRILDDLDRLNRVQLAESGDPEIEARIAQYEMAFRMQASVPELTDLSDEPEHLFELYGPDSRTPGTFAHNCLLARRLVERGVRFVQLFQRDWDHHKTLPKKLRNLCLSTDQACAALVRDLKQRGLLEDTLVVWGGEFGRTVYCQGRLSASDYGRDHHPRCFTMWVAGGGVKSGMSYGETDDYSYNVVRDPVHVHDLHATMLHLLGFDHTKLTYKFQGRQHRLTDVAGNVVRPLLA
jgi:hypothetical protein